jgi:hypothetical protein
VKADGDYQSFISNDVASLNAALASAKLAPIKP